MCVLLSPECDICAMVRVKFVHVTMTTVCKQPNDTQVCHYSTLLRRLP